MSLLKKLRQLNDSLKWPLCFCVIDLMHRSVRLIKLVFDALSNRSAASHILSLETIMEVNSLFAVKSGFVVDCSSAATSMITRASSRIRNKFPSHSAKKSAPGLHCRLFFNKHVTALEFAHGSFSSQKSNPGQRG